MATVTISLPDSLRSFVERQMETGGYGNVSEYFRSLIREAQRKEEDSSLEAALLEGLRTGGEDIPLTPAFWKDLRSEAVAIAKKHKAGKKRQ